MAALVPATVVDLEVVTPLSISLWLRDGRWLLGEVDITAMIAESDVDLYSWKDDAREGSTLPTPRVTLRLDVQRIYLHKSRRPPPSED